MSLKSKFVICLSFFMIVTYNLSAQVDSIPSRRGRPLSQLIEKDQVAVDSSKLLLYGLDNLNQKDSFHLKGLETHFQQYDPARQRDFDYGTLGNVGSAAYEMAPNFTPPKSFKLGYQQYDLYHKTEEDIAHFDQVRPFSDLFFSAGESQSDLRVDALFSRTFAKEVNWVIDYERVSQIGSYDHHATKQTSLLTSLAYRGNKRLSAFFTYIINSSVENINGGVQDLGTLTDEGNNIRENVEVFSTDATTRLQNQSLIFNAFYHLGLDSIKSDFQNSIQYQVQSFNEFFRYTDASTALDSAFYKNYLVSERGIRNYNELSRIRNAVFINSRFKDYYWFKTGAYFDYNAVDLSGASENLNELYLSFKGGIKLKKRLTVDVDFFYGLLDVANEFSLDADATLRLTEKQGFNFHFKAARYGVNYVQENVILNQEAFYDIDINPILLQTLKAEYFNDNLGIKIGGQVQNTFNFVYFDTISMPAQDAALYSVSMIYGTYNLKYKRLLLENSAYLQNQSKNHLNIPSAFTKNSISYYGKIFKDKMLLKAGLDFRYIVSEYLPYYNPVIGQFYLNESATYRAYPMVDARISFKVSSFSTFVKYENLTSFLVDDVEQTVSAYPQFDARFRFGIQWNLWN